MASKDRPLTDQSWALLPGPWTHRDVSANGIRFHIATAGTGPMVLLIHGFPGFWWSWREQIEPLADAGYQVVVPDLRGIGASDKPPRGYDAMTLTSDLSGLIRALGSSSAIVAGHGWGGQLAWCMAAMQPAWVERLVVISAPHPLRWLPSLVRDPAQRRASRHALRFQLPWSPERWLVEDDAVNVGGLLREWGGPGFPDEPTEATLRRAMQILYAPARSMEYFRWAARSVIRSDGRRFRKLMRNPITAPTLQLHGSEDGCVLPRTAQGSSRHVEGDYEWRLLDGVGHFPHQERPEMITAELLRWCKGS